MFLETFDVGKVGMVLQLILVGGELNGTAGSTSPFVDTAFDLYQNMSVRKQESVQRLTAVRINAKPDSGMGL